MVSELIGKYGNIEDADDYSSLILIEDSTFIFVQSPKYGDVIFNHYGKWRIFENRLKLVSSINLEEQITYDESQNIKTDSLTINVSADLRNKIGNFKLKISLDTTIWQNPKTIEINKKEYFKALEPKLNQEKETFYKYYPVEVLIWNQDFHFREWYIFANSNIEISLEKQIPYPFAEFELLEYKFEGNRLKTNGFDDIILAHELIKK